MTTALPASIRLVPVNRIDSTNAEALRRAAAGAPSGTLVWARSQERGRGRHGRRWQSPPGNLYASLLLAPRCARRDWSQVSFVAAVAVVDALAVVAPALSVRFKWPNDILAPGGKIAGILLEATPNGAGLVIGVGVNVAIHPPGATSLFAEGARPPVGEVLAAYAAAVMDWTVQWEALGFNLVRKAWMDRAAGLGDTIDVRLPHEKLRGIFRTLDRSGALVLDAGTGSPRRIAAGEVFLVPGAT